MDVGVVADLTEEGVEVEGVVEAEVEVEVEEVLHQVSKDGKSECGMPRDRNSTKKRGRRTR
jgi:hypothetical protein